MFFLLFYLSYSFSPMILINNNLQNQMNNDLFSDRLVPHIKECWVSFLVRLINFEYILKKTKTHREELVVIYVNCVLFIFCSFSLWCYTILFIYFHFKMWHRLWKILHMPLPLLIQTHNSERATRKTKRRYSSCFSHHQHRQTRDDFHVLHLKSSQNSTTTQDKPS